MRKLTEDELVMCADLGVTPEEYAKSTEDESMYLEDTDTHDIEDDDLAAIKGVHRKNKED